MTTTSEMGISPVLLQAITQTLSDRHSKGLKGLKDPQGGGGQQQHPHQPHHHHHHHQQVIVSCSQAAPLSTKLDNPTHILHGMNEPVTSYATTANGETIVMVQNMDVAGEEQVELQAEGACSPVHAQVLMNHNVVTEETHPQELCIVEQHEEYKQQAFPVIISAGQDLNMSNVLSAIATHLKKNRKRSLSEDEGVQHELTVVESSHGGDGQHQQPIYISFPDNAVPSPAHDVIVNDGDVVETVMGESQTDSGGNVQVHAHAHHGVAIKKLRHAVSEGAPGGGTQALVLNTNSLLQPGTVYQTVHTDQGTITIAQVAQADSVQVDGDIGKPCPICGDRISGYHYGIFTCESCKGFFKRTVQNKKAFLCHRKGDCLINLTSRKKCPACRFKRCLLYGMRLEAIREDRMRGGRSSYHGCSPHGRTKPAAAGISSARLKQEEAAARRKVVYISSPLSPSHASTSREGALEVSQAETVITSGGSEDHVITVVSVNPEPELEPDGGAVVEAGPEEEAECCEQKLDVSAGMVPQTPQSLEDLLAVETLMAEDDEEQECCYGKLRDGDNDLFGSLLHLADHCLYRIVRWARNLPDFANVSTDDQIVLLQSCWAELLCLSISWNSVRSQNNTLLLSHGRELDLEMAKAMGLAEVIQRLLDFTDHLRRLDLDLHEYISLKVLMLMTPDVKNLKNEDVIRDYQERICEALLVYSITHYPHLPNKHCELLCRLSELTRTCTIAKDLLNARQVVGEVPQFSLLSELLKGDIIVQPTE